MDLSAFLDYCMTKKGVEESFPFDETTLVLKVVGKMFAASDINEVPLSVNLKCDPEWAEQLREQYEDIRPGFHMNKKHWNTVLFEASLDEKLLFSLIDHSYDLVVKGLPKKQREWLESL
ncbi:MAG: MmcQ/YjbR family DNA-binding protein [Saprospiraceae bacterium]|nr:MmcQ/YjbR family DNA-binding protein [Saprospiraceae bacterium]